jgi:hypothetical protein
MYRQGDVLLFPAPLPTDTTPKQPEADGCAVLAHGEVTGHRHRFAPGLCNLFVGVGAEGATYAVLAADAALLHEEHATIPIPAGTYRVIIQREYEPAGWRRVED